MVHNIKVTIDSDTSKSHFIRQEPRLKKKKKKRKKKKKNIQITIAYIIKESSLFIYPINQPRKSQCR